MLSTLCRSPLIEPSVPLFRRRLGAGVGTVKSRPSPLAVDSLICLRDRGEDCAASSNWSWFVDDDALPDSAPKKSVAAEKEFRFSGL